MLSIRQSFPRQNFEITNSQKFYPTRIFRYIVYPLNEAKYELQCSVLPDLDKSITLLRPHHFELLYFKNYHYDAIVSIESGKVCLITHLHYQAITVNSLT